MQDIQLKQAHYYAMLNSRGGGTVPCEGGQGVKLREGSALPPSLIRGGAGHFLQVLGGR